MPMVAPGSDETDRLDTPETVEGILQKVRDNLYPDCRNLYIRKKGTRRINAEFMNLHRYNNQDVYNILQRLRVRNYSKTIEKEGCSDAYAFGYYERESDLEIYLKFSFKENDEDMVLVIDVISFHDPDHALSYPYQ